MPQQKPTRDISDEERERRAQWARDAHRELIWDEELGDFRPKFGGSEVGKKQNKKRASATIAEAVDDRQEDIKDALFAGLDKKNNADVRRRAAKELLAVARQERVDELAERRALDDAKRTEILDGVLRELAARRGGGGDVLEGDVSELDEGGAGLDSPRLLELEAGSGSTD